jgi:2-isopropylmalate synthase
MSESKQVFIYDCTLRDGTQGENISLSVTDKINIAEKLDEIGIHYIEGGWPGSNQKDGEFFARAKELTWKNSKIAAFGATRHHKNSVEEDPNIAALLEAETPSVTLVGKSWDFHVELALGTTLEENLKMVKDSVTYLKDRDKEVIFDAEHFFDGYAANPKYAKSVLRTARDAGADWVVLCDTNGGTLPSTVGPLTRLLSPEFPYLGIHTHNDCEVGVANSLAAVEEGAHMVQGTINGYGERCGNANLCSIIPALELKLEKKTIGEENLKGLTSLAYFVSETANMLLPNNLPFVGKSAFAHKGGIHVSGINKDPKTYEHLDPESVGNSRRVLVSDLSGKSNLLYKIREFGDLDPEDLDLQSLVEHIKTLEYEGYQFEGADGSLKLLLYHFGKNHEKPFDFQAFRVVVDQSHAGQFISEASVKVKVGGVEEHTVAEGDGPVHALDRAVKKALVRFYPEIEEIHLVDYKVRVLDARQGTAAKVRVLIESRDGQQSWTTIGVSPNLMEASWMAIIDSVLYKLLFASREGKSKKAPGARIQESEVSTSS